MPEKTNEPTTLYVEFKNVSGLNTILFQGKTCNGFKLPKWGDNIPQKEPRLILIKGEPGTGKSMLSAQLLHHFIHDLPKERYIRYLLMNEQPASLQHTLEDLFDWNFSEENQHDKPIKAQIQTEQKRTDHWNVSIEKRTGEEKTVFVQSGAKSWYPDMLSIDEIYKQETERETEKDGEKEPKLNPAVVFIDSLNLVNSRMSHSALRSFLIAIKEKPCLTFLVLEDYQDQHSEHSAMLCSEIDFLADCIIHLSLKEREGYTTYYIQVPKMHFSKQTQGEHHYLIGKPTHPTSNIEPKRRGITIYPSLHYYLSQSLRDGFTVQTDFTYTGISQLDRFLSGTDSHKAIPRDALFVLQGDPHAYMIPLGINLLCGGMVEFKEKKEEDQWKVTTECGKD